MDVWDSLLRSVMALGGLILWSRILGKKLISQMTFFDFVAGTTFGSIGGNLMFKKDVPLWLGLLSLSAFSLLVLLSDFIAMKSSRGRRLLESQYTVIIENGQVRDDLLKGIRLSVHELLMLLRKKDIFYLDEVETAILETDGTITVLKKAQALPLSRSDMNIQSSSRGLPILCVVEGNVLEENLKPVGKSRKWLLKELYKRGVQLENVLFVQMDSKGTLFVDLRVTRESQM
ncbi:DUF421 domain-containing protein [Paenibacillus sp. GP183]|uniref:DUF421 domain-containing protein n=1 Tax=Paenibacillus sp. GP183 TaxID=1882751 RepID=UPI00089A06A7|nr:DUF421 domain-containing protein [Paenibacillus sp. GP183]SEC60391.1 Uncharacterized membrane protein YcaP, DUF421 family [Paenibacillus sp. GP183]